MQEKFADDIAIMLVIVFFINALLTTLGLSNEHVAWLCFGFVFIWVLVSRTNNKHRGRKKK